MSPTKGSEEEILEQLEKYNPAQVLRELVSFPVSVTTNGCVLL